LVCSFHDCILSIVKLRGANIKRFLYKCKSD
jgi:hypothetical protein